MRRSRCHRGGARSRSMMRVPPRVCSSRVRVRVGISRRRRRALFLSSRAAQRRCTPIRIRGLETLVRLCEHSRRSGCRRCCCCDRRTSDGWPSSRPRVRRGARMGFGACGGRRNWDLVLATAIFNVFASRSNLHLILILKRSLFLSALHLYILVFLFVGRLGGSRRLPRLPRRTTLRRAPPPRLRFYRNWFRRVLAY